ncbi:21263_t:CDS:2, partial [Rhizophagus irregularis]
MEEMIQNTAKFESLLAYDSSKDFSNTKRSGFATLNIHLDFNVARVDGSRQKSQPHPTQKTE